MLLPERAWLTYQALDHSDDLVLLLEGGSPGSDAVIIGTNDAFRRASGYAEDQLVGRAVEELFTSAGDTEALKNALRGRGSLRTEMACNRADGTAFMFGLHLMPAPARTPGGVCFVVLGRDITEVLEARQMQASVQRLLAKVFTTVDDAVIIVNSAGRIVMTNPRVDLLLGHKPNGLVGMDATELVPPESRAAAEANRARQIRDGGDLNYSMPFLRADGSHLTVRVRSVSVLIDDAKQFRILTMRSIAAAAAPEMRTESAGRIKLVPLHSDFDQLDETGTNFRMPATQAPKV